MNHFIKYILIALSFMAFVTVANGQNGRKELERKKSSLKKDIAYKNKLLKETSRNKKNSLNQLRLLNNKIREREELIATITSEVNIIDDEINENKDQIAVLKKDIENLKAEYAEMIRFAYKNRSDYDKVMFVFASEDFNQAYKRIKYLQQYSEYRKRQAAAIKRMEETLTEEVSELEKRKEDKQQLLKNKSSEKSSLAEEKKEQQAVYKGLKSKEKQLKKQIKKKEQERRAIQKAIERIIKEAIRRSSKKSNRSLADTPESKALAASFTSNKGKLPWPVKKGVITERFGVHAHPILKHIKVNNNGVTISTENGGQARAVFTGEVSRVLVIPGAGKAIIIRHGDYLTVYGNLSDVYVSSGDKVKTKQVLGTVGTSDGKTSIQFEIHKGQSAEALNPAYWLYNAK